MGRGSTALTLKTRRNQRFINGNFDLAVTVDWPLLSATTRPISRNKNLGVGGFHEVQRAVSGGRVGGF
jgi:hypothetical protein